MNTIQSEKDSDAESQQNGPLNFSGEVVRLDGVGKVGEDSKLNDSDFVNAQRLAQLEIKVEINDRQPIIVQDVAQNESTEAREGDRVEVSSS